MTRFRWTQPCCEFCWWDHHADPPTRVRESEVELCVYCAVPTTDGIYVRIDPTKAPHPTLTKE